MRAVRPILLLVLVFLLPTAAAVAQDTGRPPVSREQMWPAPTAEDWAKPCLITWQRTWEDAVAVSKETGKAILICVNMDGEIASEHYAGVRYRDPEIAKLYEPYVTVIASTYRHNPRDYDDQGRRIPCPRFGTVTCGEHIAIEPILYEKFFDGQRVAPRHIMVELDGSETYDVYYANDTASVFQAIREGIEEREHEPTVVVRGDRPMTERVKSRAVEDRNAVETAYEKGDHDQRAALLDAAEKEGPEVSLDLLRLALFGLDVDLARTARAALAQSDAPGATDLIADALRVPMEEGEREALIAALARLGESSEKARWLSVVHKGLAGRSRTIDADAWAKARKEYEKSALISGLLDLEERQRAKAKLFGETPKDPDACIELAEASLDLARKARKSEQFDIKMRRIVTRHMFEDARRAAEKARELGAPTWRADAVLALVDYYRGDTDSAYELAEAAVKAMPAGEPGWNAMAVLTIFGEGRYMAIKQAAKAGKKWPSSWLSDLDAAYSALLSHPMATDGQVVWYHEFLKWLGVNDRATKVLRAGLERFPDSPMLHAHLRIHTIKEKGVDELLAIYDEMLREEKHSPNLEWFTGYATIVAADYDRRMGRRDKAMAAYAKAIEHFDRSIEANPKNKGSADYYAALALAGRARLAYEAGDDEASAAEIIKSFDRKPDAAGTKDGVGITPAETAQMLIARLTEEKRDDLIQKIVKSLDKLDPADLVPNEK